MTTNQVLISQPQKSVSKPNTHIVNAAHRRSDCIKVRQLLANAAQQRQEDEAKAVLQRQEDAINHSQQHNTSWTSLLS